MRSIPQGEQSPQAEFYTFFIRRSLRAAQVFGIIRCMRTLEKPLAVDPNLVRRADRKLRRYGADVNAVLSLILSVRGRPPFIPPPAEEEGDVEFADVEDAISYLHAHV